MKSKLFISCIALLSALSSANAAGIYDNNIAALNINMLTDTFMSYTNYGAKMSDLFAPHTIMYGTMDRLDEYGDDGSTIETYFSPNNTRHSDYFIDNVWVNANHINESMHYGNNISYCTVFCCSGGCFSPGAEIYITITLIKISRLIVIFYKRLIKIICIIIYCCLSTGHIK